MFSFKNQKLRNANEVTKIIISVMLCQIGAKGVAMFSFEVEHTMENLSQE